MDTCSLKSRENPKPSGNPICPLRSRQVATNLSNLGIEGSLSMEGHKEHLGLGKGRRPKYP